MNNFISKTASALIDWMIVLKIEDQYIERKLAEQHRISDTHRIEVQKELDARQSRESREYQRAERIAHKIIKGSEICVAKWGHHKHRSGHDGYHICKASGVRAHDGGFKSLCIRCGLLFDHNRNNNGPPFTGAPLHHIGAYCDCNNCKKFVGSESPYLEDDMPEEWVLTAIWERGILKPTTGYTEPIYSTIGGN